ncbi:hypothetical protein MVEN_01392400 [Mycena venus]|uniref:Uncharacterized protein n=1 Tax=Mycena venus TaxID=2733690 RepID=A0A8H6XXU6_9AGAR|nr:hypothetical protein MVEN_01392400 [Mycena venus]
MITRHWLRGRVNRLTVMDSLQKQTLKPGLVNLPGATPASTALVKTLLLKDIREHHCYFNDEHFHNHLSHHILALHDLADSVPPRKTCRGQQDQREKLEQPPRRSQCPFLGVPGVLERYLFSPEANGNGTLMLARFVGGAVHGLIETGFGIEFGQDFLVANGTQLSALTTPEGAVVMDMPSGVPEIKSGPPTTLLSLLREVYDSPKLAPIPFPKGRLGGQNFLTFMSSHPDGGATLREIYAKWTFDLTDTDFAKKVDECMWQATLLLGATSKAGRKPRMDFFLMHFVTGALAIRVVLDAVKQPLHKAQLLQVYARSAALFVIQRGRPRIDPALVMSYPAYPAPPQTKASTTVLGSPSYGSPWLALLNNAAVHPEPHVIKSIRMLFYCAQKYGGTPAGAVVGAVDEKGKETHSGAAMLDGTLFIRVAGVLDGRGGLGCSRGADAVLGLPWSWLGGGLE